MQILRLHKTSSTNSWVAENEAALPSTVLVYCDCQTAGRGQRGNSWESAPGENITASLIFHPENFEACRQFAISEAIALAIVDFLELYGVAPKIKWPNDIYVGDKKICGILVEHVVSGRNISRTIAGLGINMNQTEFKSDAPNPVSLKQLTGRHYDLTEAIDKLSRSLEKYLTKIDKGERLHLDFTNRLWRADGQYYNFFDRTRGEQICASVDKVGPDGLLCLSLKDGSRRHYAFKEVEFII